MLSHFLNFFMYVMCKFFLNQKMLTSHHLLLEIVKYWYTINYTLAYNFPRTRVFVLVIKGNECYWCHWFLYKVSTIFEFLLIYCRDYLHRIHNKNISHICPFFFQQETLLLILKLEKLFFSNQVVPYNVNGG